MVPTVPINATLSSESKRSEFTIKIVRLRHNGSWDDEPHSWTQSGIQIFKYKYIKNLSLHLKLNNFVSQLYSNTW